MIILLVLLSLPAFSFDCHYEYTVWNTKTRSSEGPYPVKKWKKDLTRVELGPLGCTLCEEDQIDVKLKNGKWFRACKNVAQVFIEILESTDFPLVTILGYRPSRSRGPVDSQGLRTEFSNHAYGIALDINENFNGLYSSCVLWGPGCVLTKGGVYLPESDPRSLTAESPITKKFHSSGFLWGGEIKGLQKDFMHFSPDGY